MKATPTQKIYHLVEMSDNLIKMRVQSNAREVPYCDCFCIDEEMIIHMPSNCQNSAVMRVTMTPVWH